MSTTSTIIIRTDRGDLSLPAGSTLADAVDVILQSSARQAESVATAVNGIFVARQDRAQHCLESGDAVLCFSPITGG